MSYAVRETDAASAAEAVVGLWRRNLPAARGDLDAKLRWFYVDGPTGPARVMLLEKDATAVGCAGIGKRRFSIGGEPELVDTAILADLAVDKAHRTVLPALTLTRATRAAARRLAPIHYGFPNPSAVGLFERMGYRKLGAMTRWVRILRHRGYIEKVLSSPIMARAAGALVDAARLVELTPARFAALPLRLEKIDDVDERFDRLWEVGRRQYGAIAWRGAAFLRWRFLKSPTDTSEVITLVERRGRGLRAYAVLERLGPVFHVRDVFGISLVDCGVLLDLLVPVLRGVGASAVSLAFLGSARVEAMLREHRFVAREATRVVVVDARPGKVLPGVEEWYVTDGDEDNT